MPVAKTARQADEIVEVPAAIAAARAIISDVVAARRH
jgi:hypothetical protein